MPWSIAAPTAAHTRACETIQQIPKKAFNDKSHLWWCASHLK
jgi:hypothetical protein